MYTWLVLVILNNISSCIVNQQQILSEAYKCSYWIVFFIFQEINYDSPRGGVSVITEKGDITTSYLLIQRAKVSDSGKYMCSPSSANPETVNVHILNGKYFFICSFWPGFCFVNGCFIYNSNLWNNFLKFSI